MTQTLYTLALLACPVGMGLMMWFMMRGMKHGNESDAPSSPSPSPAADAELTKLRAEVDQLRAGQRDSGQNPSALPATEAGSR
ncbi:DUF2933 domain-containing protein [Cryobacterium sp. TMS1-13-1]|uniref:DUF2933 domain-containing protein n=1 Tax=Cryobacterium sp. TMS1-13-1 TaxID=1259220 RepID=UPI0010695476|nr:DUF2933 domain-containing protein [Cryobacterium sp. TMS1-13-1]TFD21514.1 DUF2933 domain-containing protein [Cryobacterium sp. TMS1-13-1]